MTKQEFIKKYCWAPESAANCHQITWDLMEEITETLQDVDNAVDLDTSVGALLYKIDILLEVIDKETPDCDFLKKVMSELEKIE